MQSQHSLRSFVGILLVGSATWAALAFAKPQPPPDPILITHAPSMTTYPTSTATLVQDALPRVENRGTNLDGSLRFASTQGMAVAQNPFEDAWRPATVNGVRLDTGSFELQEIDVALPADGFSWVIARTYNARQKVPGGSLRDSNGYQGKNWFQNSQPEIVLYEHPSDDDLDVLIAVYGADRYAEYRRVDIVSGTSNTFEGINGASGVALFKAGASSEPDTYTILDQQGREFWFFGFDSDSNPAKGQLWKILDAAGNTAFVGDATTGSTAISSGFDGSGRILKAYDPSDRRYTYTYTTLDGVARLTKVEAETKSSGTWASPSGLSTVGKVEYSYYTSESYGDPGDLKIVKVTTPLSDSGVELVQKKYFRYWEGTFNSSTNPGHPHALKYVVGFEGTRQQDWADDTFDEDFLALSDANLEPYASAFFEYDSNHRINEAWFNGDCGCSGGNTGTHRFEYETNGSFSDNTSAYDEEWKLRTVVERPDGTYLTQFFDEVSQGIDQLITDDDPDGTSPVPNRWLTHVVRDSDGLVTGLYTPATVTAYTHSTGLGTYSTSAGLVHTYTRETSGAMTGFATARKWSSGTSGTAYYDQEWAWTSVAVGTFSSVSLDTDLVRPLLTAVYRYQAQSTSTGDRITFDKTPAAHSSEIALESDKVTNPSLGLGARSPASPTEKVPYFRLDGTPSFTVAEDDIFSYQEYDNGRLVKSIEDADTAQASDFNVSPSSLGITSSGTEFHRITTYSYDPQGRLDKTTQPDGRVLKQYYSKLADGRMVVLSYNDYETSPSTKFYGPVRYTVQDHAGNAVVEATVALTSNESTTATTGHVDETDADPITALDLGTLARLTVNLYSETGGKLEATRLYHDIPGSGAGSDGTNYDATVFGYDDSGHRWRTKEAHGTISRSVYDARGRVRARWTGTNDASFTGGEPSGTDNMVKVEETEYDGSADDGNSFVTKRTLFVQDNTTGKRETTYTNDVRGRVLLEARPTAPHAFHAYDNEGHRTATGFYSSTASITVGSDNPVTEATNRLALRETGYDTMGRVEGTKTHKIDPSDGSDDDYIYTETTLDEAGRELVHRGERFEKSRYDRLGRRTHRFILAATNDSTYANAYDVSGDTVLEEHQTVYESSTSDDALMQVVLSRYQNAGTTGALDSNADTDDLLLTAANLGGRAQITALWYDRFGRVTDTVLFGTNGGSNFDRDGLSVPSRSDTALRTTNTYATDGTLQQVEDPRSLVARHEFDDAGREVKTIRNYNAGVNSGNPSGSDDNHTVLNEYADGLRTEITADMPSGQTDQVTTYTYGTAKGTNPGDSKAASGHLLQKIQYPDSAGGTDVVTFAYNAQGETIYRKDQAGNILEYVYDDAGRQTQERITTLANGFDGAVRRIARTYTSLGEPELVSQYDDATVGSGTLLDQVKYSYDGWRGVSAFEQDRNSAVGASGSVDDYEVSYTYEKSTDGRVSVRRTGMTLPDGTAITYTYDLDEDDEASRVSEIKQGELELVTYLYKGATQVVGTAYPSNSITSKLYGATAGTYPDLDRFDRPITSRWTSSIGTAVDFHNVSYTYDRNSNVVRAEDNVHVGLDVAYTMDDLDRLSHAEDGTWSGSAISSTTREQDWTLDQAGNWDQATLDLNGDTDFGDAEEYNDDRTHNVVNELTGCDIDDNGTDNYTLAYDVAGNLTDDGEEYEYVHDPLGRMRKVLDRSDDSLVAEYLYNGLGFLVLTHEDTDDDSDVDASDKWFHSAYDEAWRRVATFRESDSSPKEQFVNHQAGYDGLGGSSYINLVAVRGRDFNTAWTTASDGTLEQRVFYCQNWHGDVTALVHNGPLLVEWDSYSAYGIPLGRPGGDSNSDGDADVSDGLQIAGWINAPTYDVRGDLDLDHDLDQDDLDYLGLYYLGNALGWGQLSWLGNCIGFAGALLTGDGMYHSRARWFSGNLGRWHTRDKLEYVDEANLYCFVIGNPVRHRDASGLQIDIESETSPDTQEAIEQCLSCLVEKCEEYEAVYNELVSNPSTWTMRVNFGASPAGPKGGTPRGKTSPHHVGSAMTGGGYIDVYPGANHKIIVHESLHALGFDRAKTANKTVQEAAKAEKDRDGCPPSDPGPIYNEVNAMLSNCQGGADACKDTCSMISPTGSTVGGTPPPDPNQPGGGSMLGLLRPLNR